VPAEAAMVLAGDAPPPSAANEIRDLANQLIHAFGIRSTSYARHQALKARERGEGLHHAAWQWIAGATVEILRAEPDALSRD